MCPAACNKFRPSISFDIVRTLLVVNRIRSCDRGANSSAHSLFTVYSPHEPPRHSLTVEHQPCVEKAIPLHNFYITCLLTFRNMDVRKTFNRLIHDLTQFGKDNWRSLLMLGVMGAVTGGVNASESFSKIYLTSISGMDGATRIQQTLPCHIL